MSRWVFVLGTGVVLLETLSAGTGGESFLHEEADRSTGRRRYRAVTIHDIRNAVPYEEIDYAVLASLLAPLGNVRDKIGRFLKAGELIRVKKGLYVFGPSAAHADVQPFVRDPQTLALWSKAFFRGSCEGYRGGIETLSDKSIFFVYYLSNE